MKRTNIASLIVCLLAGAAVAQGPPQMPAPGPEHKRLQYFAGTWASEYELKPGPFGPGGKINATDRSDMMPGGFFLVTHTEGKSAMGDLKGLAVMGYDSEAKAYTYDAFNNFGEAAHFKGSVQGDTWTWTSEGNAAGKPVKLRFTAKVTSPTSFTMKFEFAGDAGWSMIMEGKSNKVK